LDDSIRQRATWANAFFALGTVVLAIAVLRWAAPLLIPIGVATLLAFLLTPPMRWLEKHKVPRILAVSSAVLMVVMLLGGLTWTLVHQADELLDAFPRYEDNVRAKIALLRGEEGTLFSKLRVVARKVDQEISAPAPAEAAAAETTEAVKVTVVRPEGGLTLDRLPEYAGSIAPAAGGTVLAFVLLAFVLMRREDLRERIFGIVGRGRLPITTRAIDEATERITRMLAAQFAVNSTFGIVYGLGLYFIGIPFAPLWGLLAIALRYIPFVGAFFILCLPFLVSLLTMQGWTGPLLVLAWFLLLEITVMGFEAWLIGPGIGVSPAATLVMLAFWTWLWGPIALLLATPLTACLMVVARFLPSFRLLEIALGNRPVLAAPERVYQRLLSRDVEEAGRLVCDHVQAHGYVDACDRLLLPALAEAAADAATRRISTQEHETVLGHAGTVLDMAADCAAGGAEPSPPVAAVPLRVLCIAREETDRLGYRMLQGALDEEAFNFEVCSTDLLVSETVERIARSRADLICIGSTPSSSAHAAKLLSRRLRKRFPLAQIVVARWGGRNEADAESLCAAGASGVYASIDELRLTLIAAASSHQAAIEATGADLETPVAPVMAGG
jgi:predicted PurR-regulated permease PerM